MCKVNLRDKFFKDNNIKGVTYSKTKEGDLEVTVKSLKPGEYFSSDTTYLFKKDTNYDNDSFMSKLLSLYKNMK